MRIIKAQFRSLCHGCKDVILPGTEILYEDAIKKGYHLDCQPAEQDDLLGKSEAVELADRLGFE